MTTNQIFITMNTNELSNTHPARNMKLMKINDIHQSDCIQGMKNDIPDESVDLVVADPPYFKVIGKKWDYEWRTEKDYVEWSSRWIAEAARTLRLGGSFYIFGYFRTLAQLIPVLESNGLKLRQQIILDKGIKAVSGRATKNYKMFPNVTESILFLVKDPIPFSRELLKSRQLALGKKAYEINEALGVKSNGGGMWSIYTGKNICEQLPTEEHWNNLQKFLDFELPYEKINITFNAEMGITDVWRDIEFYFKRSERIHPTQKPLELIERLIKASSNPGDVVLDPFMGSGTTAVAASNLGRKWVGYEKDEDYFIAAQERLRKISPPSGINHPEREEEDTPTLF